MRFVGIVFLQVEPSLVGGWDVWMHEKEKKERKIHSHGHVLINSVVGISIQLTHLIPPRTNPPNPT